MRFSDLFPERTAYLDLKGVPKTMVSCEACPRRDFAHKSATDEVASFLEEHDLADDLHDTLCHVYTADFLDAFDQLLQVGIDIGSEEDVLEILIELAESYYALAVKHAVEGAVAIDGALLGKARLPKPTAAVSLKGRKVIPLGRS